MTPWPIFGPTQSAWSRAEILVNDLTLAPCCRQSRPRLPLDGRPTGPDASLDRTLAAVPLEPVALDPVSIADDPSYAQTLQAQRNLGAAIKEGLTAFYPI